MNHLRSTFLALGLCVSFHARAVEAQAPVALLEGRIFPAGTTSSTPAFTLQRTTKKTGDTSVLGETFKDMDGNTLAILESTYIAGALQPSPLSNVRPGKRRPRSSRTDGFSSPIPRTAR